MLWVFFWAEMRRIRSPGDGYSHSQTWVLFGGGGGGGELICQGGRRGGRGDRVWKGGREEASSPNKREKEKPLQHFKMKIECGSSSSFFRPVTPVFLHFGKRGILRWRQKEEAFSSLCSRTRVKQLVIVLPRSNGSRFLPKLFWLKKRGARKRRL